MISPSTATGPPKFEFKTPRQPMLWAAVTYCLAIVGGTYAWRPMVWWLAGAAMFVAALGLLIVDPRQLFTASFQMTFLSVLIVAGIGIPMLERTSQQYRQALTGWDSARYAAPCSVYEG